ncbi:PREDICTED: probable inactive receptor kinase At5g53320 [Tarenaya hassleriana]|uniref:probable inactive receptor kinase At5g53320 n=1 Tax=Tarenaya hassleriana TaxID=28532 RepID=UPI00053C9CDE|nr:PREDICTED: probable inactive receptor kinase At5g53320 [Tarenaya hassleriana]
MSKKMTTQFVFSSVLLVGAAILLCCVKADSTIKGDKHALIEFLGSMVHHSHSLNWRASLPICTGWLGVTCNHDHSGVVALRLPSSGLRGSVPANTIARLKQLRILNLGSNNISGNFPSDLYALKNLTELHLESNKFSGPLPSDFSAWETLSVLDLTNNSFNGSIPASIGKLTRLESLNLGHNELSGEIPDLGILGLKNLELAYNNLTGTIPESLQRFPRSTFTGNNVSLGNAVPLPASARSLPRKHTKHNHAVLSVTLSVCFVLLALLAILLVIFNKKEINKRLDSTSGKDKAAKRRKDSDTNLSGEGNKMVFFEGRHLAFDLEDLLRASAEVLGKDPLGTIYKVDLEDSVTIVVKRIKEIYVTQRDFEQQMEIIGHIKHENVATLRGYFYSKDEKLVVYDYHEQGSLSTMLHGWRGLESRKPLDWEARLKIVFGAARGIAHIHSQSGGKLVHGNIKSSNIFVNPRGYGCIYGAGLATLMHPLPRHAFGYRAPELTDTRKATQSSDVYSFGVLIFEILTGKPEVADLVRWVNSVVREEWTGEVFDEELLRCTQVEEEMVEMLQVGMACTARLPEKRPNMAEVVSMVDEIRPENLASGYRSEVSSGSALYSTRHYIAHVFVKTVRTIFLHYT